jgi:hypothetical protein
MLQDGCQPLSVVEVPITTLNAYPHNARTHSKHQIRQIADSIRTFGFTNPVLEVFEAWGHIRAHGRHESSQKKLCAWRTQASLMVDSSH